MGKENERFLWGGGGGVVLWCCFGFQDWHLGVASYAILSRDWAEALGLGVLTPVNPQYLYIYIYMYIWIYPPGSLWSIYIYRKLLTWLTGVCRMSQAFSCGVP